LLGITKTVSIADQSSEIAPHFFHSGSRKTETEQSRRQAVKQAITMMQANYHNPLSLQNIADSVQLSPFHFNRVFRSITGVPPSLYLAALRIDQAKKLLLSTNLSVTSICFDIGYNSLGTFTTRFTQLVGTTPTQLRRLSQEKNLSSFFQDWNSIKNALGVLKTYPGKSTIEGNISIRQPFDGLIFIGLFQDPIPQNDPICATVLTEPGYYSLPVVPEGKYYLFATALQRSDDFRSMLESEAYFCCTRQPIIAMQHDNACKSVDLALKPKSWTDVPILLALPWLLISKMADYYHMPLCINELFP
jgi:AraC family transcriptional regulator